MAAGEGYDDAILAAAEELQEKLHTFDGVIQIRSDFSPARTNCVCQLKPEARNLGLTR